MKRKFIVRRYCIVTTEIMENDMNALHKDGYYPKEIKLDDYQNLVDATIVYELNEDKEILNPPNEVDIS